MVNGTVLHIKWSKNYLKFLNVYFMTRLDGKYLFLPSSMLHAINTDSILSSLDHNPNSHFLFFIILELLSRFPETIHKMKLEG